MADKRGTDPPPIPKPRHVRPQDRTLVAKDIFSHRLSLFQHARCQTSRPAGGQTPKIAALFNAAPKHIVIGEPQRVMVRVKVPRPQTSSKEARENKRPRLSDSTPLNFEGEENGNTTAPAGSPQMPPGWNPSLGNMRRTVTG